MPVLGADMDEGTLVEWLVKPGDQIHKGDIIAVVNTAKSAIEVESFHTGTIAELITPAGETVPVGTVLATITEAGAEVGGTGAAEPGGRAAGVAEAGQPGAAEAGVPVAAGAPAAMAVTTAGAAHPVAAAEAPKSKRAPGKRAPGRARPARKPAPPGPGAPAHSTPLVRHEAAQLGVDLATVHGTGPGENDHPGRRRACGRIPAAPGNTAGPPRRRRARRQPWHCPRHRPRRRGPGSRRAPGSKRGRPGSPAAGRPAADGRGRSCREGGPRQDGRAARQGRTGPVHAAGDRPAHGPVQTGDPALLREQHRGHGRRPGLAARTQPQPGHVAAAGAGRAAAARHRARRPPGARTQRILDGGSLRAGHRRPPRGGDLAARRRPDHPRHPPRRRPGSRRADGQAA